MAHNEAANVGLLLETLRAQRLATVSISEITVVASGCTDETESMVRAEARRDARIRLIVQLRREGKASAINEFLRRTDERIVVLCSADLLPTLDTIEQLVAPFKDAELGMSCARPVPVNDPGTFMGFAAHMLWNLHHQINSVNFKAGEMIALRKIFERIPYHTAVDEASIEPVIRGQGYSVLYVPNALVYNKGPETAREFLRQRRRIYAGHLAVRDLLGYSVSTMNGRKIFGMVLRTLDLHPRPFMWTWGVAAMEVYARWLGFRDYKNRHDHSVWEIAKTTKEVNFRKIA
jgi:cellulose synthase/poly-beta-1,6-N-acetylglucosamine synthase-like glycosyltransferase